MRECVELRSMNSVKDKEGGIKHLSSQILQITIKKSDFNMKHPDIVELRNNSCRPYFIVIQIWYELFR